MHREDLITTIEMKDRNGNVIETREVVRYAGLLTRAHEEGLKKIETVLVQLPTEENGMVAVATAKVETEKGLFTATADATLANANRRMHRFLTALAETRAKARALRDASISESCPWKKFWGRTAPRSPRKSWPKSRFRRFRKSRPRYQPGRQPESVTVS
jgi:hypothetical protein